MRRTSIALVVMAATLGWIAPGAQAQTASTTLVVATFPDLDLSLIHI